MYGGHGMKPPPIVYYVRKTDESAKTWKLPANVYLYAMKTYAKDSLCDWGIRITVSATAFDLAGR